MLPQPLKVSLALIAVLCASAPQASPDRHDDRHHHDHDRARAALERGEVRPIGEILAGAARAVEGDIVEVELEREHGRWLYELKVIAPDGRVLEVLMDAATASVIEIERY